MGLRFTSFVKKTFKVALVVAGWFAFLITFGNMTSYETASKAPVLASKSVYTGSWKGGYFTFSGTFQYENADGLLYPELNSVSGKCWLPDRTCSIATATFQNGVVLANVQTLEIVRWDQDVLTMEENDRCVTTVFTATRSTASVTGAEIARNIDGCNPHHKVKMTLVDGYDVHEKVRDKVRDTPLNLFILISSLFAAIVMIVFIVRKPNAGATK